MGRGRDGEKTDDDGADDVAKAERVDDLDLVLLCQTEIEIKLVRWMGESEERGIEEDGPDVLHANHALKVLACGLTLNDGDGQSSLLRCQACDGPDDLFARMRSVRVLLERESRGTGTHDGGRLGDTSARLLRDHRGRLIQPEKDGASAVGRE